FTAAADSPAGTAKIDFQVGYPSQSIEIGGISLLNYKTNVTLASLPDNYTYERRGRSAFWRAPAIDPIDQFRKANLQVLVQDAFNHPIPGANVHVQMKRHAFPFGSAVVSDEILGTSTNSATYRAKIIELFNRAVTENDLKWPDWEANRARATNGV